MLLYVQGVWIAVLFHTVAFSAVVRDHKFHRVTTVFTVPAVDTAVYVKFHAVDHDSETMAAGARDLATFE